MANVPGPDDKRMWRQLLARCHPDAGGSEELFKWAQEQRERREERLARRAPAPDPYLQMMRMWFPWLR